MLMPVMCGKCMTEMIENADPIPKDGIPFRTKMAPIQTVGLYRSECERGHKIVVVADFQQFELLFESAMEAFADSYFRESVSSFAAALERFYEFAIQTFLIANRIENPTIELAWKSVAAQSERQLGMFVGLYTAAFKTPPKLLSTQEVKFRNSVIHKGHFPSPQEAFDFGQTVYDLLNDGIKDLRTNFSNEMEEARDITREAAYAQLKPGEQPQQFGMSTTISLFRLDAPQPLRDAVQSVAANLQRHRSGQGIAS